MYRGGVQNKKRSEYIEILRVIACLMVIFNHSNERGFGRYSNISIGIFPYAWNMLCSLMCKSAVPIFFMISGAMLLNKDESIRRTLKRIPKILIDLILFSLIYFGLDARLYGNKFVFKDILQTMLTSNYWHLWYLYSYIALILTLPFLRKVVRGLDIKDFSYIFVLAVIIKGTIPIVQYFGIGMNINWNLVPAWIASDILIYPVTGYMIAHVVDSKNIKPVQITSLWILNIICILISETCEYFFLLREPETKYADEMFLVNFSLVNATILFLSIKIIFESKNLGRMTSKVIIESGKCTFGIYLLHIFLLWKIPYFYNVWIKLERIFQYFGIFISCTLVFVITGIIVYFLRKIPGIRRLF